MWVGPMWHVVSRIGLAVMLNCYIYALYFRLRIPPESASCNNGADGKLFEHETQRWKKIILIGYSI